MSPSISSLRVVKIRGVFVPHSLTAMLVSRCQNDKGCYYSVLRVYIECLSYFAFLDHAATYNTVKVCRDVKYATITYMGAVKYQLLDKSCTSLISSFFFVSNDGLAASCLYLPRARTRTTRYCYNAYVRQDKVR